MAANVIVGTGENNTFVLKAYGKDIISDPSSTDQDLVRASFDQTLASNVENLTLINNNLMLDFVFGPGDSGSLARVADPAKTIVGSWVIDDEAGRSVVTFLPDGTYMHVQNGPTIGDGHSGVEVGTYTWNSSTHAISILANAGPNGADTNGDWGFTDGGPDQVTVEGNILTMSFTGEGDIQLTRVVDASDPAIGSWYQFNGPDAEGIAIVTFLGDGHYAFGQSGNETLDPSGQDGIEYGTYSYNDTNNLLTYHTSVDTTGEWGLSIPSEPDGNVTATIRGTNGTGNTQANTLTGDAGVNQLSGLGGQDTLVGGGGNDKLFGGNGADQLFGGAGKDILNGGTGTGQDRFYFDSPLINGNADTIQAFQHGVDKIMLDDDIFTVFAGLGLVAGTKFVQGTAALDANDYLVYDIATGRLYYDADGSGDAAKKLIATLGGHPVLDATDFKIVA